MASQPSIQKRLSSRWRPYLKHPSCSACASLPPLRVIVKTLVVAFLPTLLWLVMFIGCRYIPETWRPGIAVDLLPALDEVFFDNPIGLLAFSGVLVAAGWIVTGGSYMATFLVFVPLVMRALRELAASPSAVADVLAFLPYGVLHYISPALFAMWLWRYVSLGAAIVYLQSFGVQNVMGVATQIIFPSAAPWYNDLYGFAPASYSMPGNPGGLARVDKLFGTHIYTSTFNASPLVFGAMPSLHSGFAVLIVLFAMHYSRRAGFLLSFYMCWQWWATMYLRHHYMVDLVVGGIYSCSVYLYARRHLSALPASRLGLPTSASSASLASLSLSSSTSSLSLSPSLSASSLLPTVMNSDFKLLQVVVVDEKQPLLPPEQLQMTQIQHSPRVGEDADQTSPITPPVGAGVGVGGGFKSRKASDREPGNANGGPVVDGLGAGVP